MRRNKLWKIYADATCSKSISEGNGVQFVLEIYKEIGYDICLLGMYMLCAYWPLYTVVCTHLDDMSLPLCDLCAFGL